MGKTMEREMLKGQTEVRTKTSNSGSRAGPPTEREYPVDPVWVATINPSAWKFNTFKQFFYLNASCNTLTYIWRAV